ncbi:RRM_1 domain-containing protein [Cephalotus follicularis]|uniref:RRM_1 domain-containing protein n=1 Tax=Cephalotus follicularis TaxID=3775 RepID=A0A1Q3D8H0_CEPFO|nr:RRM_1 domain-containing protein [Cephalotus follicularis]
MTKKRKQDSKSSEPTEPPKKQQQKEPKPQPIEEEEEEEYEVEEEEYEEVEEEEEEEEEEEAEDNDKNTAKVDDDDYDEPIEMLLEPFGKEQLISLLRQAADKLPDVADLIRRVADEDPVHRKIFVHGLGWDTNADTLTDVFKEYGEIEDCKAVCDKISGKSKGYAFILFRTRGGARKALKEPQKKIGNRMTACQLASIGPAQPQGSSAAAPVATPSQQQHQTVSEVTQKKIYVSNVGADLDPQKLLSFFAKYGDIEDGPLGLDKVTGKPKGFCLFVYKTVECAKKALEEPHKNFEGHILHCQKAIDGPKPGKSQYQHHNNAPNSHRNDNSGFVGGPVAGPGQLMSPIAAGIGPAAAQALNPALGQALTALLASQGAALGLNPALGQALLGTLGSAAAVNQGMPGVGTGMQGGYVNQSNISQGVIGGYGNQGGYPNQQMGQGGSGRGQHGYAPYMGH